MTFSALILPKAYNSFSLKPITYIFRMSIAEILFFLGFVYFLFLSFRVEFQSFKTSLNFLLCLIQLFISSHSNLFLYSFNQFSFTLNSKVIIFPLLPTFYSYTVFLYKSYCTLILLSFSSCFHGPIHSILLPVFIIQKLPLFLAFSTISYLKTYRGLTYTTSRSIVVPCHSMRRSTHHPRTGDDLDFYSGDAGVDMGHGSPSSGGWHEPTSLASQVTGDRRGCRLGHLRSLRGLQ